MNISGFLFIFMLEEKITFAAVFGYFFNIAYLIGRMFSIYAVVEKHS